MSFLWPPALLLLLAVPVILAGYVALSRRRAGRAADLAARGFVPNAAGRRLRRLRHVPFALFLTAVVILLVAFARPQMRVGLPHREGTVILAFDVSNSMRATDLEPTRMDAAKAAARTFVERQPDTIKMGVVAFSGVGFQIQEPTTVKADVLAAIDRLSPDGSTSLGEGIFTSLNAIAGKPITADPAALAGDVDNLDIGYYGSAAVVLLSDGENTAAPDPLALAQVASVAGVKIYPIGLGSPQGSVVTIDGFSVATSLDEELLKQIASDTSGTYYNAADTQSLADVYKNIDLQSVTEPKQTEITAALAGASILLLVIGAGLSLAWFGRLV